MRTPQAYLFDRNCVLASTAGQVAAAVALDCPIAAIKVGETPFNVGFAACDILLTNPQADAKAALIAAAGALSFTWAMGKPTSELTNSLEGPPLFAMQCAEVILLPLVASGRLAALARRLGRYSIPGDWRDIAALSDMVRQ